MSSYVSPGPRLGDEVGVLICSDFENSFVSDERILTVCLYAIVLLRNHGECGIIIIIIIIIIIVININMLVY